jgi:ubiquinone biosynthesis protein UbiJ
MLTAAIENLLNRNLSSSTRARELCNELRGRQLAIWAAGTPWSVLVESLGSSLKLTRSASDAAEARVYGSPLSLVSLAGPEAEAALRRGDVRIEGDIELAQQYRQLLQLLRPDLEEELSRLIGDSPAHRLFRLADGALAFGRRSAATLTQTTGEYLVHEQRVLVPRAEAEALFREIESTRDAAERLAARLRELESPPT